MSPLTAVAALWIAWYSTWILAVVFSRRTQVQMKSDMVGAHRFLAGLGAALLFTPQALAHDHATGVWGAVTGRLWAENDTLDWSLFGLTAAGFAFCWWARLHLGSLWSGYVTLKEGHRIIDTGPYGLVRHPIYTGLIFSGVMTALIGGTPLALFGACLLAVGFSMTAGIEEGFLRRELGAGAYDDYSRRVGKLIPGLK